MSSQILASVGVAALVAGATAFALPHFLPDDAAHAESAAGEAAALAARLQEQRQTLEEVQRRLQALESRAGAPERAPARVEASGPSDAQIEEAVARYFRARGGEPGAAGAGAGGAAAKPSTSDAKAAFQELLATTDIWNPKLGEIWKQAREAGKLDELVKLFEARAKENPGQAQAHTELGKAYLQKLFAGGMGPEAGLWGTRADKAFDRALEADPEHWEARFQKAVSLANWPDFLGRKPEAVRNLETLVTQQETRGDNRPEYLQTYLILGNLYSQQGKDDKAREIWQKGLRVFPNDAELRKKLGR